GVRSFAGFESVPPAETLLLVAAAFWFGAAVLGCGGGAVGLAEGVAASNERNGLLVVHGHAAERLPNVPGGGQWIRVAIGPLRIHVDQAHLHGAEGVFEHPVAAVALVPKPLVLGPPV